MLQWAGTVYQLTNSFTLEMAGVTIKKTTASYHCGRLGTKVPVGVKKWIPGMNATVCGETDVGRETKKRHLGHSKLMVRKAE